MEKLAEQLKNIIKDLYELELRPRITSSLGGHGDFSSNVAMQIAKEAGKAPREVAAEIAAKVEGADVEVAGPGFLNFTLKDDVLVWMLEESFKKDYYAYPIYQDKVVLTEFSDPNPFKVLHMGHLYTSVVGDSISRLMEYAGAKVYRLNFGGDVGMHVAKAMWGIMKQLGDKGVKGLDEVDTDSHKRAEWISRCYVEGSNAYEDDEKSKAEIVELNQKIYGFHTQNDHESDMAQVYWKCREWSYEYFEWFYEKIGVKFDKYYPESATSELGLETVKRELANGVYTESDGAVVFVGEPYGLHTRVFINNKGLPTYEAKDVGLIFSKWEDYHFDKSIVITAGDIIEYMKVVLTSIKQYAPELVERSMHLTHGIVKLPGMMKMSSRKGNFVTAVDVVNEVKETNEAEHEGADFAITLGAIKYVLLKNKLGPDMMFDIKESVSLTGNSGPYLQYALARAKSILRKASGEAKDEKVVLDEWERTLVLKLLEWKEVIREAVDEVAPHVVCTYLYELAQTFSRFYENDKVVGGEKEKFRCELVQGYINVLESGLTVLGVPTVEKV